MSVSSSEDIDKSVVSGESDHEDNCSLLMDIDAIKNIAVNPAFLFNFGLAKHFLWLEKRAIEIQYQLACLSTLGGAYHLCNNPKVALAIAFKQEKVGHALGSSAVVIRSKVFQAVNWGLLGQRRHCEAVFAHCKQLASRNNWADMFTFVKASELWYITNHTSQVKTKRKKQRVSERSECVVIQ